MLYLPIIVYSDLTCHLYRPIVFKPPSSFPIKDDEYVLVEYIYQINRGVGTSCYYFVPIIKQSNEAVFLFNSYPSDVTEFEFQYLPIIPGEPLSIKKFGGRKQCFQCFLDSTYPYLGPPNQYNDGQSEACNAAGRWISIPFYDWCFKDSCESCGKESVDYNET
ncbi:MAG: hypothetical protein KatS3mg087_0063 [Patescibacteria group bacterium]|nr:MAG: hypothetical protein KatS3mg087_0063 [Patescibacteria group bacterium]